METKNNDRNKSQSGQIQFTLFYSTIVQSFLYVTMRTQ